MPLPLDVLESAWRVVEKQEKRNAKDPLMHPERARHNLMTAIGRAIMAERERCAAVARGERWRDPFFVNPRNAAAGRTIADMIMREEPVVK